MNSKANIKGRIWGRWSLDTTPPPSIDIPYPGYPFPYQIVLTSCRTEGQRERWLKHMAEKRFISEKDLIDLRRAFNDLVAAGIIPGQNGVPLSHNKKHNRQHNTPYRGGCCYVMPSYNMLRNSYARLKRAGSVTIYTLKIFCKSITLFQGVFNSFFDADKIEAGYKPSRAKETGFRLVTYGQVWDRYLELQEEAKSAAIMPVIERKERPSRGLSRGTL